MTALPATWLDIAVLAVVLAAAVLGATRGAIRGLFSLLAIPASVAAGSWGYRPLGALLHRVIPDGTLSLVLAFFVLMIGVVAAMVVAGAWTRAFARRLRLGVFDGVFGTALGIGKGLLLSGLVVWLALGLVPKARPLVDRSSWAGASVIVARGTVRLVGAHLPRILPGGGPTPVETEEV